MACLRCWPWCWRYGRLRRGIGQACTVHMDAVTAKLRRLDQVAQFFLGIDGAVFGGLGQAEGSRRLAVTDLGLREDGMKPGRLNLPGKSGQTQQTDP